MCDFSLHAVRSRPAKVGDKLTTRNFGTGTRGFAASEDADVAVCLMPGTELSFVKEIETNRSWWSWGTRRQYETAIFRQVNQHNPRTHHDAVEFSDGKVVLLTLLPPGRRAIVLQLPVTAAGQPVPQRAEYV
jgi:hypothetical protein